MNNKDTISRAALLKELDTAKIETVREFDAGYKAAVAMARIVVKQAPSVPPQVVHGRWNRVDDWTDECSECGRAVEQDIEDRTNYCPNCGARMDGGGDDAAD